MQYNRHQIDERATEVEVQEVRQQIQSFEKVLEEELAHEDPEKSKLGNSENKINPTTAAISTSQPMTPKKMKRDRNHIP